MMRGSWRRAMIAVAVATAVSGFSNAAHAAPATRRATGLTGDFALCQQAIEAAERSLRLPSRLLGSVGTVESGRLDAKTGRIGPWPWTINVAGTGHFFETKAEAIAAVAQARAAGIQSIDVGCMQVNLLHHPTAFASLDDAFDPALNALYAAGFLSRLHNQLGTWPAAATAYHSQTPGVADEYRKQVMAIWPLTAKFGWMPDRGTSELDAIDPHKVYTPEFRARLLENARDRETWAKMGLIPTAVQPAPARRGRARLAEGSLARGE